jgi:hypothetical protein
LNPETFAYAKRLPLPGRRFINPISRQLNTLGVLVFRVLVLLLSGLLLFPGQGHAMDIGITTRPPQVDGILEAGEWDNATAVPMNIETEPRDNVPAEVETTAYLMRDGEFLYVAFDAREPNPEDIRAFLRDRDRGFGDDAVGVLLDPVGNGNLAYEFFSNPLGVQVDAIEDDLNKRESTRWDAIWDAAGHIHDKGFVVEMAIPLNLFRTPDDPNQAWGIELLRMRPRDFRQRISSNPRRRNLRCHLCQMLPLEGMPVRQSAGSQVQWTPTLVIGGQKTRDDIDAAYQQTDIRDPGLDVRWTPNPQWTINGTINPDFSQVEADAPQSAVNTTSALFFQEKRPFFLEGADEYTTPAELLYTRLLVEPSYGLKITGQTETTSIALFTADDSATRFITADSESSSVVQWDEKSSNTVVRLRKQLGDLSLGVLGTYRSATDYRNQVVSTDLRWNLDDHQEWRWQWMASDATYPEALVNDGSVPKASSEDTAWLAGYHFQSRNWQAWVNHENFGEDFHADMAFFRRTGFTNTNVGLEHRWWGEPSDFWSQVDLGGEWSLMKDAAGDPLLRESRANLRVSGPWQSRLRVGGGLRRQVYQSVGFDQDFLSLWGEVQPVAGLRLEIFAETTDDIDFTATRAGRSWAWSPEIGWNIGRHWRLDWDHYRQIFHLPAGRLFTVRLNNVRLAWRRDNRTFVRLTLQDSDVNRNTALYLDSVSDRETNLGVQLLYGYQLDPKTLVYVGANTAFLAPTSGQSLHAVESGWFAKFSYAWQND